MESIIITDSCTDFNEEVFPPEERLERIPFKITIDEEEIVDRDLDISHLIAKMKASKKKMITACPSPHDFMDAFKKCKNNFVVTISSKLSASHSTAVLAKELLAEDGHHADHQVHIFDSKTAAAGQTLVVLKVKQLLEEKFSVAQIIEKTNHYIDNLKTLFVLESLDNLIKNGRVSPMKGFIGSAFHIVPIMGAENGEIVLRDQVRGKKRAITALIEMIGKSNVDFKETILSITHVNAKEKALMIKDEIQRLYGFKDVLIFRSGGLSTVYADDGGIVIAF